MTDLLNAICNIIEYSDFSIKYLDSIKDPVNDMGTPFEIFIKDSFANSFNIEEKEDEHNKVFSWTGSRNFSPDAILRNSDAIEIKKSGSEDGDLQLNSSHPRSYLIASDRMIDPGCKICEDKKWDKKHIIYCIGTVNGKAIKSIWMVYGNIYAAKPEKYQRIKKLISDSIDKDPNIDSKNTKELAAMKGIDPLKISNLRVRGMWIIKKPKKVFGDVYMQNHQEENKIVALIPLDRYENFHSKSIKRIEKLVRENDDLKIFDREVKDPNNPTKMIKCKMIVYSVTED